MLYTFRTPYPDELLYSYFQDLARINALTLPELLDFFSNHTPFESKSTVKDYDLFYSLSPLVDTFPSGKGMDIFFKTSIYPILSPFMTDFERTLFIGKSFSDFVTFKGIWPNNKTHYFRNLKVCPHCMGEDEATYGHWYYHRSHQVEGLKLCPIHGIPLITSTNKTPSSSVKTIESKDEEIGKKSLKTTPPKEFSKEELDFQKDYGELIYLLSTQDKKLKDKWIRKLKEDKDIGSFLLKVRNSFQSYGRNFRNDSDDIKHRLIYFLTYSLYPSSGVMVEDDADYEVEKSLGDNIYLCRCKICGRLFISTKILLDLSYTCPCTRKGRPKEIVLKRCFDHSFSHRFIWLYLYAPKNSYRLYLYDKKYSKTLIIKPTTLFSMDFSSVQNVPGKENMSDSIDLDSLSYSVSFEGRKYIYFCKVCGSSTSFDLVEKYIGDCPSCEKLKLIKESKKIISDFSDELIVLEDNIKVNRIPVLHTSCGGVSYKQLPILRITKWLLCPKCSKVFHRLSYKEEGVEKVKKEVREILKLYGNSFTLKEDEDFDKMKIPLIHNACKGAFYGYLYSLRKYNTMICPICRKRIKKKRDLS